MVRPLRPGDIRVLLGSDPALYNNLAKTRDDLVADPSRFFCLKLMAERLLSPQRRPVTWVYPQNGGLRGLASTRNLAGSRFWQVHRLILTDGDVDVCRSLLEQVARHAAEQLVQKVFLRAEDSANLLFAAKQSGFLPYQTEVLYRGQGVRSLAPPSLELRPRTSADDYPLFQLYSAAVPDSVRRMEATTFGEWSQSRERSSRVHKVRELVYHKEGEARGWLRLNAYSGRGLFEMMLHPSEAAQLNALVDLCLGHLSDCSTVLALVPSFQSALQQALSERGFQAEAEYLALVKELALKVGQPSLAPVGI